MKHRCPACGTMLIVEATIRPMREPVVQKILTTDRQAVPIHVGPNSCLTCGELWPCVGAWGDNALSHRGGPNPPSPIEVAHTRGDHYNGQPGGCPMCPADLSDARSAQQGEKA